MIDPSRYLAQRLLNRPLAMHVAHAEVTIADMAERHGGLRQLLTALGTGAMADEYAARSAAAQPYTVTADGVAIIPIRGVIVQRFGLCTDWGITGLDGVRTRFALAMADQDVRAIAMDIDSVGGEVAGTFDLVDAMHAARGTKPIWAILNEEAYSAAYAIASAADRISVPRTGGAGSIGVLAMLVEWSKAMAEMGVTVNLVRYGKQKMEVNQAEPLSDPARARVQAQVDECGELFVATVARNRGMTPAAVRDTEAGTFLGPEAVRLGLADIVAAPDEAYRALVATL